MNKDDVLCWHVEGTLDTIERGVVLDTLEWPLVGGVRAYVVKPDNPKVIAGIVPVDRVVKNEISET